ncbi:MAG: alanine racemase [Rhodospirillaceae bacterium]
MIFSGQYGAVLTIDLHAIASNFRFLKSMSSSAECAAVVKCNAYGLGIKQVGQTLLREGCRAFFVASSSEALSLKRALLEIHKDFEIYILNGFERDFPEIYDTSIAPVLNSLEDIRRWVELSKSKRELLSAIANFDTGMNRLGLDKSETAEILGSSLSPDHSKISILMSHLACSEDPEHRLNHEQFRAFSSIVAKSKNRFRYSLANSGGVFLGKKYHFDLVRPGAALFGIGNFANRYTNLRQVVTLKAKILQTRSIDAGVTVGYGATQAVNRKSRLATVALGYGDGIFRGLTNAGFGYLSGYPAQIIGRVSMDLVTLDVTDIPQSLSQPGYWVEFIGEHQTPDSLAQRAGTIGYEVLTALGSRYERIYLGR